ncbi:MAG: hypothetical protein ACPGCR_03340, partial [Acholeplasmataceae bacterium]
MTSVKNYLNELWWVIRNQLGVWSRKTDDFFSSKKLGFITRWPSWFKALVYLSPALILLGI